MCITPVSDCLKNYKTRLDTEMICPEALESLPKIEGRGLAIAKFKNVRFY